MPTINLDFEVFCDECGEGLCNNTAVKETIFHGINLRVEPCEKCLESKYQEGLQEGIDSAHSYAE